MTRINDVKAALDQGVDALGFVVATPASPRNLQIKAAKKLINIVPVYVSSVAVTANADPKTLQKICVALRPNALQMHQHNSKLISALRKKNPGMKFIAVTAIRNSQSINEAQGTVKYTDAVLADSQNKLGLGGSGKVHDWRLTRKLRDRIHPSPLILAGGLTPNNVEIAMRRVRPYAVDVSTGVELRTCVKDHYKMMKFIKLVKEFPS
jgi:phosphoribosylanthranilate isomerase